MSIFYSIFAPSFKNNTIMGSKIIYVIITNNGGEITTCGCFDSPQKAQDKFNSIVCKTLYDLKNKNIKIIKSEHNVLSISNEENHKFYEVYLNASTLYYDNDK